MKSAARGAVLLYAVTAFLLASHHPDEGTTLLRLLVLAALFYAAYRYNLSRAESGPDAGGETPGVDGKKVVAACLMLLVYNLLPSAPGGGAMLRDNFALLFVGVAFFAVRPPVREYGFVAAWAAFNTWLCLATGFSYLLAPLFIVAACHCRFTATARALGEEYGCPGHGVTPVARRNAAAWVLLALLLFVPLHLWGWREDRRIHPPLTTEERAAQQVMLDKARAGFPLRVSVLALGLLILAFILWRQLRQRQRRGKGDSELQAMLSAQGYVRPLDEPPPARYHFPGGPRGHVLKTYEKLLAGAEKKCKKNLRCLTPAQREEIFRRFDGNRPWSELTAIYNRARYSGGEITAADVAATKRCAN